MITCGKTPCYGRPTDAGEPYCYQCQQFVTEKAQAVKKAHSASVNGPSEIERKFDYEWYVKCSDRPGSEYEWFPFHDRKHRIDRAWPDLKIAVEIEGFGHGLDQYQGDIYKYNRMAAEGWLLLRCNRKILFDEPEPFFDLLRSCIQERL
jgi:hypothetical protein